MDVTDPSFPDRETSGEVVDDTRRLGLLRTALIRLRYRHLTDKDLWNLRVGFDCLIAANSWDLAANVDELNDRYSS